MKSIRSREPPGRFLTYEKDTALWSDIGDEKAIEKTSQALREGQPQTKENMDTLSSMIPADIPTTTDGFAEFISRQAAEMGLIKKKKDESPKENLAPELDRTDGSLDASFKMSTTNRRNSSQSTASASEISIFSQTPSVAEMFTNISHNLSVGVTDCSSLMGSAESESQVSKMSVSLKDESNALKDDSNVDDKIGSIIRKVRPSKVSVIPDDELRQAARKLPSIDDDGPDVVDDMRKHFRDNKNAFSDLTSSMTKMGVSNMDYQLYKSESGRSLETCPSLKSIFKKEYLEQESEMDDLSTAKTQSSYMSTDFGSDFVYQSKVEEPTTQNESIERETFNRSNSLSDVTPLSNISLGDLTGGFPDSVKSQSTTAFS